MRRLALSIALLFCLPALGEPPPGRWASHDNVAMAGSKAGSKFFLDVTLGADGSFKGTWEEYVCFSYPGAYGIATVSCQRSKKPRPASGRLDAARGSGSLELAQLGKGSFRFKTAPNAKGQPQLEITLPRDWLKQGDPILYESSLSPRGR